MLAKLGTSLLMAFCQTINKILEGTRSNSHYSFTQGGCHIGWNYPLTPNP